MGKKFNLGQKSQNLLQRQKGGSPATKLEQQRVIIAMIDDLDRLRRLPRDFKLITPNYAYVNNSLLIERTIAHNKS